MSIRSGYIRDQSRKLSKIVPKFERYFALPKFRGRAFQKLYLHYQPCIAARRLEKFRDGIPIPISLEVIRVHTHTRWILGQILNFRH